MLNIEERPCERCGKSYKPRSKPQRYCGNAKVKGSCSYLNSSPGTKRRRNLKPGDVLVPDYANETITLKRR